MLIIFREAGPLDAKTIFQLMYGWNNVAGEFLVVHGFSWMSPFYFV